MSQEELKNKASAKKEAPAKKADTKKKSKFRLKKKEKKVVINGKCFVNATFNNTIVSITDKDGNVLSWSSAGSKGFKRTARTSTGDGRVARAPPARDG